MIYLQSSGALAAPQINDFELPKNEIVVQNQKEAVYENAENKGDLLFENLNTGMKIPVEDMLEGEVMGIYKEPYNSNNIMVISFQDKEDLREEHSKIKKILKESDAYESSYDEHRSKELSKKYASDGGSFHSAPQENDRDYNFISFSTKEIKEIQESARAAGYSEDLVEMLPTIVLLHEIGHSHDHQQKVFYDYGNELKQMPESKVNKMLDEVKDNLSLMTLGGENYADSYMMMSYAKLMKERSPELAQDRVNELTDYFMEDFRDDSKVKKGFNVHATKATVKTTEDFINNNWDNIDKFEPNHFEQFAASITNRTLNDKDINKEINNYDSQVELAEDGGLQKEILEGVSERVGKKMIYLFNITPTEDRKVTVSVSYDGEFSNKYTSKHKI